MSETESEHGAVLVSGYLLVVGFKWKPKANSLFPSFSFFFGGGGGWGSPEKRALPHVCGRERPGTRPGSWALGLRACRGRSCGRRRRRCSKALSPGQPSAGLFNRFGGRMCQS